MHRNSTKTVQIAVFDGPRISLHNETANDELLKKFNRRDFLHLLNVSNLWIFRISCSQLTYK